LSSHFGGLIAAQSGIILPASRLLKYRKMA
jgi:hypothetical protein